MTKLSKLESRVCELLLAGGVMAAWELRGFWCGLSGGDSWDRKAGCEKCRVGRYVKGKIEVRGTHGWCHIYVGEREGPDLKQIVKSLVKKCPVLIHFVSFSIDGQNLIGT